MGRIVELSEQVANMIAAGEVVERPASVIKELMENSVDAGAAALTVEVQNGGAVFMRLTDNGSGMSKDDAESAFLRHATSKIRRAEDLASIGTLGFRGEALAAIAAVSRVELMTREGGAPLGTCLTLEGGAVVSREEIGCPEGTTIIVRDLFFNTPARKKFLKRDITEASYIQAVVMRAALASPEISFKLIKDGRQELHTPGDNRLSSAIYASMGREFFAGLLPVNAEHMSVRVAGYASKPQSTHGNRQRQHFFVNRRPIRSPMLSTALEEAYKGSVMTGRFPACVLHLELDERTVDVNVHPSKQEIKFASERDVFDALFYAVRTAVEKNESRPEYAPKKVPSMTFTYAQKPVSPPAGSSAGRPYEFRAEAAEHGAAEAVLHDVAQAGEPVRVKVGADRKEVLILPPVKTAAEDGMPEPQPKAAADTGLKEQQSTLLGAWRLAGELFSAYIIVEDGDEVVFIDKHAAHERIIYEQIKKDARAMSQALILPVTVRLLPESLDAVNRDMDNINRLGFDIGELGHGGLIIRAVPDGVAADEAEQTIGEIAQSLIDGKSAPGYNAFDELLHLIACKAAVKAGMKSGEAELFELAERVMKLRDIRFCPHGRPVAFVMKKREFEKQFKRV